MNGLITSMFIDWNSDTFLKCDNVAEVSCSGVLRASEV